MMCELSTGWKQMSHSQVSNAMDQQNMDMITSALLGDNNIMLSAVASLLQRRQSNSLNKEHDSSLMSVKLDLTNTPSTDAVLANVLLGTAQNKSNISKAGLPHSTENLIPSFEQVHALATANLVASTQRDIAKQLAEASSPACVNPSVMPVNHRKDQELRNTLNKRKSLNQKKSDKKRLSKSAVEPPVAAAVELKLLSTSEPKALICSYEGCNRKFAWLNHLKYHELTHTNDRQFKCLEDSCGKTFFTAQRLSVHQRTHTGEKPFRCPHQDCDKTFTTAGNLKNHQRIHTGEQPFTCDHLNCNRRFTEQSSLRKHKLTHSGDKPFECNICGRKFTQSGSRRQHVIRHHLDDEISQSFKQESAEKDVDDDDDEIVDEGKEMPSSRTSCSHTVQTEAGSINAVSCSSQVLMLNNAYTGLSTSESIVLSHGLSDHIVTVKTEVLDHPMSDSNRISLSHTLLPSDGLHDAVLQGKNEDFVVLPESSIYEHDENTGDIVYTANILDHEEVTHADYVNSHVDYSGEITHSNYSSHRELSGGDDFVSPELSHSDNYISHAGDIAVTEYVATECIQHVSSYTDSKSMPHSYLDSDQDIAHTEFIGAEEVAIAQYSSIPTSSDLVSAQGVASDFNQGTALLTSVTENYYPARKMKFGLGEVAFSSDQSVVVVEVSTHSSRTLGTGQVDREIHMDPMMECDEEPEKSKY